MGVGKFIIASLPKSISDKSSLDNVFWLLLLANDIPSDKPGACASKSGKMHQVKGNCYHQTHAHKKKRPWDNKIPIAKNEYNILVMFKIADNGTGI